MPMARHAIICFDVTPYFHARCRYLIARRYADASHMPPDDAIIVAGYA